MPSRTILAKAYSILRGSRKKEDVPLDEFFHLCAPRIGIIPPDQYQQLMGWQISPPDDADQTKTLQVVRLFTPDLDALPNKFTTTNLSADDLVEYCVQAWQFSRPQPIRCSRLLYSQTTVGQPRRRPL